jgi:hypothetical protein
VIDPEHISISLRYTLRDENIPDLAHLVAVRDAALKWAGSDWLDGTMFDANGGIG